MSSCKTPIIVAQFSSELECVDQILVKLPDIKCNKNLFTNSHVVSCVQKLTNAAILTGTPQGCEWA
jgi:hypothetical protein